MNDTTALQIAELAEKEPNRELKLLMQILSATMLGTEAMVQINARLKAIEERSRTN